MNYQLIWFVLIAVLWTAYLVLEGFDFGVGSLLSVLGKGKDAAETEKRRRVMLTTIGPHWDGNEVWLLTAGGATFAAFPVWYATMFSGFYLALFLILLALIVRNMGFEYRHKRDNDAWRRNWDIALIIGSILPPLLLGVALTNIVRGLPLDANAEFIGNFFTLLNPMSLLGGLVVLGLSLTHGTHFLAMKTDGDIREQSQALGTRIGLGTTVLAVILLLWLGFAVGKASVWVGIVVAAVSLLFGIFMNTRGKEGLAFIGTSVTMAAAVATYFFALYPNVINGSDGKNPLTIEAASSTELTLKIMTGAALVFTPIVLIYTAWTYWVFRKRISTKHIPAAVKVS
jgi:cytochrome bd ubiquinol oxidase subunit II